MRDYSDLLCALGSEQSILLYGLSDGTRTLLEACPDLPVVGLLDGFQTTGEMYGQPVVALEDAVRLQVEAIVIVARQTSTRIIAKRIEQFCREQGIRVYDLDGRDMLAQPQDASVDAPYFHVSLAELQREIASHEVITFDVFDTLVMRCVAAPEDIFALLEAQIHYDGFARERQAAEHELYRGGGNPTLAEIYALLEQRTGWSHGQVMACQRAELEAERYFLRPRRDMVEVLAYARRLGKRVCLISDMYLPAEAMVDMLRSCGVTDYDALLVSCEYRTSKSQGLFDVCRAQFPASTYLHIGDSPEADGTAAQAHGFDTFHVASAREMAEMSGWCAPLSAADSLAERLLAGWLLERVFNSPFALQDSMGKPTLASGQALGFCVFGPMLVAFFYWVLRQAAEQQDVILWAARDGYLFAQMHRELITWRREHGRQRGPQGIYFYTSRGAALPAAVQGEADIRYLVHVGFAGTPQEMLRRRFGLRDREIMPPEPQEELEHYVLRHEAVILRHARTARRRAQKYIRSLGLTGQRLAFVDLVSSGSCHMATEVLSGQRMQGYYLVHIQEAYAKKQALVCKAYLEDGGLYDLHSQLATNYEPLETIVMSHEPSLADLDGQGRPVFGRERRTTEDLQYLAAVQEGVMSLFRETLLWQDIFMRNEVRPTFVDGLYGLLSAQRTRIHACPLAEAKVSDDFTNRVFQMRNMFE